ncbi:MAG: methyltransferase, partial [Actinobacteria bacterium]|nr:methyltransferase [Actinomycetota bacterium]
MRRYRTILADPLWQMHQLGNLRNQTKHLLLGVRGTAPIRFRGQGSWLYAPAQAQSHKPEEADAVIGRCSSGPY